MKKNGHRSDNSHKSILFIGAGASLAARASWPTRPPLGKQLLCYMRDHLKNFKSNLVKQGIEILNAKALSFEHFEKLLPELRLEERLSLYRCVQVFFS